MLRARSLTLAVTLALAAPVSFVGCAPVEMNQELIETGEETGLMETLGEGTEEAAAATSGPVVPRGAATEVWAATNAWADTNTEAARAAGPAWEANSGLTWEQKFDRWVGSFRRVPRNNGSGYTFEVTTPWGTRKFNAPTLECAETATFLRVTFSSWYNLPFFIQGWAAGEGTIYVGHFGFVTRAGARLRNFPAFRTQYRDYTSTWREGQPWPTDAALQRLHNGTDDAISWLPAVGGAAAGSGAYFDQLFLNKRVGYFVRLALLYTNSANLADGANMFHIRPANTSPGDLLIERWQRQGIGHVLPVMRVDRPMEGRIAASVASGSMPRRQPYWEEPDDAVSTFTVEYTGGEGNADDGTPYARLGGGIRRWRTAVLRGTRWMNEVLPSDESAYIPDSDVAAISARPGQFRDMWETISPEDRRDSAIGRINAARMHLRMYPASCAARTRREEAFNDLYAVMQESFNTDRAAVNTRYRQLEDYVFAELQYTASKTCCWNSTTAQMAEIVLDLANKEQAEAMRTRTCVAPTVFRNEGGGGDGYNRWRTHAMSLGRASQWVSWREDESCAQRAATSDPVTAGAPAYCPR